MANNKQRMDDLEASLGLVREEVRNLHTSIDDKIRSIEVSLNRTMEESLNRMMETMTMMNSNREGGSSAPRGGQHVDEPPLFVPTVPTARNEQINQCTPATNRGVKLEFPKFNGGDPTEWMSKAKQYFMYHDMQLDQRVSFASYHLTEEANRWWQAKCKSSGRAIHQISWETFELELWTRFGPIDGENFDEELCHIRQKGSLLEYQREFEKLQNQVEGWTEKALVGAFMGGLHTSISSGIRIFKPKTLLEIINLARLRDDQLQMEKRWSNPRSDNTAYAVASPQNEKTNPSPKKLSWEELKRKRSLGLCFSCDERYLPGHKCKQAQVFMMECEQDDDEEEEHEPGITLHSLLSGDDTKTLQIQVVINQKRLVALIDSGSTFNFIDENAAKQLNLKVTPTKSFVVCLANGTPLRCTEKYNTLMMAVKDVNFSVDMYCLPLAGVDVVLGIPWLGKLGTTICDWKGCSLAFTWDGQLQILHGLTQHQIHQVQQENTTTEDTTQLEQRPLNQNLEDKVSSEGGGIDESAADSCQGQHVRVKKRGLVRVKTLKPN